MKEKEEDIVLKYAQPKNGYSIKIEIKNIPKGGTMLALNRADSMLSCAIFNEKDRIRKIEQAEAFEEFKKMYPRFDINNCTYAEAMRFNNFLNSSGYEQPSDFPLPIPEKQG
jgi:hypothetical protein